MVILKWFLVIIYILRALALVFILICAYKFYLSSKNESKDDT